MLALWLASPAGLGRSDIAPRIVHPAFSLAELAESTLERSAEAPRLHSILASVEGELVLERYFNGAGPNRSTNIKSASKSVISALVGVAIDRGFIPGVETPIAEYFSYLANSSVDPAKRAITIEDLLTMRSGLESTSGRNYGRWAYSKNWVRFVLDLPLIEPPGRRMNYSTGNTHLLSAILTKATGKSSWDFAQEALAEPLGFRMSSWSRDPQGIYFGGNNMALTPRQMLAFGEMYLAGGRWGDKQVVPREWVEASFQARGRSRRSGQRYGYGWWTREFAGRQVWFAWGYGGQYIFLIPELDLVFVTTSSTEAGEGRRGHRGRIFELFESFLEGLPRTRPSFVLEHGPADVGGTPQRVSGSSEARSSVLGNPPGKSAAALSSASIANDTWRALDSS